MFSIEEDLKRRIKKYYDLFDPKEKIYLDGASKDIQDPAFLEYQKDIIEFIKRENSKNQQEQILDLKVNEEISKIEELQVLSEENEDELLQDKILDIEVFSFIENKVNELILYFDLAFFNKEEEKEKLKNMIINDMFDRYVNFYLTDRIKENIIKIIRENVEHEFREYQLKKKIRINNLFNELKENFFGELEKILLNHRRSRNKDITENQKENFFKYLINFIDSKYIKDLKRSKKLNNEDYLTLKTLSEKFIFKIYQKLTS